MPALFDPFTIRGVTLRNRIGVSPMCQYSYRDGFSNEWQLVHLGARAAGGAGLIITEASAVEARGRITPYDVGLWSDAHIEPLARVTRFLKERGAVAGIQIAHAGRKACTDRPWDGGKPIPPGDPRAWQAVGPSPLPFAEGHQVPHELSTGEIREVQKAFRAAAARALEAGFEWLEIHGAHGYLIHSFIHRFPTAARTSTAAASITGSVSSWKPSAPCGPSGRRGCRSRCGSPARIGLKAAGWWRRRSGWPAASNGRG